MLETYHDRITNLHLKDRTADGGNLPWGQGQTPIKEVLQLMKKEKRTFPAEPERRSSIGCNWLLAGSCWHEFGVIDVVQAGLIWSTQEP